MSNARAAHRAVLHTLIWIGVIVQIGSLIAHATAPWGELGRTLVLFGLLLLLLSYDREKKERISELERQDGVRFRADDARNARMVELMDSAWRNDPTYREQRTKREAQEKYLREMLKETSK